MKLPIYHLLHVRLFKWTSQLSPSGRAALQFAEAGLILTLTLALLTQP